MTRNPFRFSASEWLDPPILIAGEVHNSSSSSPKYMEPIWEKADRLNLNTLVLPVTWEMVEEKEGNYNFLLVQLCSRMGQEGPCPIPSRAGKALLQQGYPGILLPHGIHDLVGIWRRNIGSRLPRVCCADAASSRI